MFFLKSATIKIILGPVSPSWRVSPGEVPVLLVMPLWEQRAYMQLSASYIAIINGYTKGDIDRSESLKYVEQE